MAHEQPIQTGNRRWLIVSGYEVARDSSEQVALRMGPKTEALELAKLVSAELIGQQPGFGRAFGRYRLKAAQLTSSLQAFVRRGDFDTIYTTGEDVSLWLAPLLRGAGWKGLLITIVHNCGSSKARKLMRLLPRTANDRFVCFSRSQERILIDELDVPSDLVRRVTNPVDYEFFAPAVGPEPPCIFAAGSERRDYPTLAAAAEGLDAPVVISASGFLATASGPQATPANVTVLRERVSFARIKALYASARIVAVPVLPSTYAAGVNGILEGMAMGKPIVATRSSGIEDYLRDGESGRVVEPGDPAAMRRAIEELWSDPALCAEIGRRNREWIERNASIPTFCERLLELEDGQAPAGRRTGRAALDEGLVRAG